MRNFNKLFFLFCVTSQMLVITPTNAQYKKRDSLLELVKKDREDTNKVNHLNALGYIFYSINPDSTILLGQQATALAQKMKFPSGEANGMTTIGIGYWAKGDFSSSLENLLVALTINENIKNKKAISKVCANIGMSYRGQGNYPKALEYDFRALTISEELHDSESLAKNLGNISVIYSDQNDYDKALETNFRVLKINEKINRQYKNGLILENIGTAYYGKGDYDKALDYFFQALKLIRALGNKQLEASTLGNIGNVYAVKSDNQQALDYYSQAFKIAEEIADNESMAWQLTNISNTLIEEKKYTEAYDNIYRALQIAAVNESKLNLTSAYKILSILYEESTISLPDSIGGRLLNMEQMRLRALHYFKSYMNLCDTLYSEENKKQLVQKQMNYEFDKKEAQQKAEQDKKDTLAQEELKQKEQQRNYFIGGFALVLLLAGFIFRSYRQKQKANEIISLQKLLVEEKQKEILDSIHYAKRIQQSMMRTEKYISKNLNRLTKN